MAKRTSEAERAFQEALRKKVVTETAERGALGPEIYPALPKGRAIFDVTEQRRLVAEAINAYTETINAERMLALATQAAAPGHTLYDVFKAKQAMEAYWEDEVRKHVEANLAIGFKSGVVCLYTSPRLDANDYLDFTKSSSKGKWVLAHRLGAKDHPAYAKIVPDPSKIIHYQPVASSWCVAAYLLAD